MQNPAFFHGFAVSLVLPFSIQKCFSAFGTPFLPTVCQRIHIDVSPNVKPPLRNPPKHCQPFSLFCLLARFWPGRNFCTRG